MLKIEKGIVFFMSLTLLAAFISKGVFNISSVFLVVFTAVKIIKEKESFYIKDRGLILLILATSLGLLTSFYNLGIAGFVDFIEEERFLLYLFTFYVVQFDFSIYRKSERYFYFGAGLSVIQSYLGHYKPEIAKKIYPNMRIIPGRMGSFQNNIRWGQFLSIIIPSYFNKFFEKNLKIKVISLIAFLIFVMNLPINGGRAGMLSSFLSLMIMLMLVFFLKLQALSKGNIAKILVFSVALFVIISSNDYFIMKIKSIGDIEKNKSNIVRLNFIKISNEIIKKNPMIGYGPGKSSEVFYEYIELQNEDYKNKYYYPYSYLRDDKREYMGTPFENNYINMLVDYGILFTVCFNLFFLYVVVDFLKYINKLEKRKYKFKLVSIIGIIIASKTYEFFFPGTDNYSYFFVAYFIGYGKSMILKYSKGSM